MGKMTVKALEHVSGKLQRHEALTHGEMLLMQQSIAGEPLPFIPLMHLLIATHCYLVHRGRGIKRAAAEHDVAQAWGVSPAQVHKCAQAHRGHALEGLTIALCKDPSITVEQALESFERRLLATAARYSKLMLPSS
jgi:hypothetical protein